MKNFEIIKAINNLNEFTKAQDKANTSFLTIKGQFAIKHNLKSLMTKYEPYRDTLAEIQDEKGNIPEDKKQEVTDLLNTDVEVELTKVAEVDFKDGATFKEIMLLDFMTE